MSQGRVEIEFVAAAIEGADYNADYGKRHVHVGLLRPASQPFHLISGSNGTITQEAWHIETLLKSGAIKSDYISLFPTRFELQILRLVDCSIEKSVSMTVFRNLEGNKTKETNKFQTSYLSKCRVETSIISNQEM